MTFRMKYSIERQYLPPQTLRRPATKNKGIIFIVAHDTGNDGSTAKANVSYFCNSANEIAASAHVFVDDHNIIECIPLNEKAYHVRYNVTTDNELYGCNANDNAIGVELCYSNKRGRIDNAEAYKRYVWYMAYLCDKFNLDPQKKISGHNELDPSRKTDPYKNAFQAMGISRQKFLADVEAELAYCRQLSNEDNKEDDVMKLQKWQKDLIVSGITEFGKLKGADGMPLINSPQAWIQKVNNGTLTVHDLAIINFAVTSRQVVK